MKRILIIDDDYHVRKLLRKLFEKEGMETIREIKGEYPDVRIIAISGGGRISPEPYLRVAKDMGADYTFPKPINKEELLNAVRDLLQ